MLGVARDPTEHYAEPVDDLTAWLAGGALALLAPVALVALLRSNELFALSIRDGRVLLVRGRIPPALFAELADVAARARVSRGLVRAVSEGRAARLVASRVPEVVAQRMRNVLAQYPLAKLRSAPPSGPRNLGQRLGLSWLAWALSRR